MARGFSFIISCTWKGTAGFILGACRQSICFVPVIMLFPTFLGINGILYAQPITDVISAIVTVFMMLHLHKELVKVDKSRIIKKRINLKLYCGNLRIAILELLIRSYYGRKIKK